MKGVEVLAVRRDELGQGLAREGEAGLGKVR